MLKMIYNTLSDRHDDHYNDDDAGNSPGDTAESTNTVVVANNSANAVTGLGAVNGQSIDDIRDIGTHREKLQEIRDWHLSKAQMSWSLETQERHQQFANWLDAAIAAPESGL